MALVLWTQHNTRDQARLSDEYIPSRFPVTSRNTTMKQLAPFTLHTDQQRTTELYYKAMYTKINFLLPHLGIRLSSNITYTRIESTLLETQRKSSRLFDESLVNKVGLKLACNGSLSPASVASSSVPLSSFAEWSSTLALSSTCIGSETASDGPSGTGSAVNSAAVMPTEDG